MKAALLVKGLLSVSLVDFQERLLNICVFYRLYKQNQQRRASLQEWD